MNQWDHLRATRLDGLARFRESDRVAPVQEQNRILCSQLLGNGTADSAAGACDEVTLHCVGRKRRTSDAQRPTPNRKLRTPQRKPIVRRLGQTQSNQLLVETIIDPWPKRADDIFSRRRRVSKIFRFEIQMSISPWLKRFFDRFEQRKKIVKGSAARIVLSSDGCFRQVSMTVTERIIALAIKPCVLRIGKRGCMQSVCRVKRHLQSQKNRVALPCFRKKIVALVQTDALERHHCVHAFVDVSRQTLGRDGTIL